MLKLLTHPSPRQIAWQRVTGDAATARRFAATLPHLSAATVGLLQQCGAVTLADYEIAWANLCRANYASRITSTDQQKVVAR